MDSLANAHENDALFSQLITERGRNADTVKNNVNSDRVFDASENLLFMQRNAEFVVCLNQRRIYVIQGLWRIFHTFRSRVVIGVLIINGLVIEF